MVLLSNAPRPFAAVVPHMTSLGVDARGLRRRRDFGRCHARHDRRVAAAVAFCISVRSAIRACSKATTSQLSAPEAAEAVVCSGLYDDTTETPADYADLLAGLAARSVAHDLRQSRHRGGARRRAHLLRRRARRRLRERRAARSSTPASRTPPIYQRTLAEIARLKGRPVAKEKILCIGDGVETDLKGAHRCGPALGVHRQPDLRARTASTASVLEKLFAATPFAPAAALSALVW